MDLKLISKHRSAIMAIAMLWIGFYHSYFDFNNKVINYLFVTLGYGGADIFLFLSSFGLYFAYKKEKDVKKFYKKRLLRILPCYVPLATLICYCFKYSFGDGLVHVLGLNMWFGHDLRFWFVSLILHLYLITPFYLKRFNERPYLYTFLSVIISIIVSLFFVRNVDKIAIFSRIPIFFLGFLFGYLVDNNISMSKKIFSITLIAMLCGFIVLYCGFHNLSDNMAKYGIYYYPFILIVPALTIILSLIIEKVKIIQRPLYFVGKYTLEFYILNEFVLSISNMLYGSLYISGIHFDLLINAAVIIVTMLISIIYKEIVNVIIKKIC